jgi:predicted DNA-binding protein (MmcQ/YjbR family)
MAALSAKRAEARLIAFAQTMPEAWEDHPWDHTVLEVGKKIFVFFGGAAAPKNELSVTVKLPVSYEMALTLPYAAPAGHGLWRGGWAHFRQKTGDAFDLAMYEGFIVQFYCAVAPKKLSRLVGAHAPPAGPSK